MNEPADDGVTHVNVYSRGKTELGRMASNFAHTPFQILVDRVLTTFASVEAWWYWRRTGDKAVMAMHGLEAKARGRALVATRFDDPTPEELLRVYQAKTAQTPRLAALLRANTLPFDHYYVYGGKRKSTEHQWTGELWSKVVS